jgi:Flp pilus assembly protein TadD
MSRTLTLLDAGWESVRSSAAHGRRADALTRTTRLLARPDLPASVAAEAHRLAGELLTEAHRYSEARRHLRAAAALEPSCARTFHLWGLAHELDPHGCDRRAAVCFRHAAKLEPNSATYRAAFGRAAVRCGRTKTGTRALVAAADTAPADVAVMRVVIDGLLEAGQVKTATRVLTRTRFLTPGNRELATLGERVKFEAARRGQREFRRAARHRQDAELATDGGRAALPFVRVVAEGGTVRRDVISLPRPHFPRLMVRKADR